MIEELKLPWKAREDFSDKIEYQKEGVSKKVEFLTRWFWLYFPSSEYLICEISTWRFRVEKNWIWYVFQMYTDKEMKEFANKYFYPALSNWVIWWTRPEWYWYHPPQDISWGWYFLDENWKKINWNPFEKAK